MISDMVEVNCQGECGIMRTHEDQRRIRSRCWSVTAPKFNVKFIKLALLAYILILKPASALILSHQKSDSPSTHNLEGSVNFDSLGILRKQQVARRTLLQDGRVRPTPTGYPPPGNNEQVVPRAPSFSRRGRPP